MAENPEKITYKQLWGFVFEDCKPKGRRLKRIFDANSDFNKRLTKYSRLPNFDKEFKELGFELKRRVIYPDYVTLDSEDFYFNDKGDVISVGDEQGIIVVTFNDKSTRFESDVIGEKQRMALEWIKEIVKAIDEKSNT